MENTKTKSSHGATVPYIVYESAIASMERYIKRLWLLLIVAVIALVGSILMPGRYIVYKMPGGSQTSNITMIDVKSIPSTAVSVRAETRESHGKKKQPD